MEDESISEEDWSRRSIIGAIPGRPGILYDDGPGFIWISNGGHSGGKCNNKLAKLFSRQGSNKDSSSARKSANLASPVFNSEVQEGDNMQALEYFLNNEANSPNAEARKPEQ
jgi:hypothetical protein